MKKKNLILFYPSYEKGGVTNILQNLLENENSKKFIIHIISSKNFLKTKFKKKNFYLFISKSSVISYIYYKWYYVTRRYSIYPQ